MVTRDESKIIRRRRVGNNLDINCQKENPGVEPSCKWDPRVSQAKYKDSGGKKYEGSVRVVKVSRGVSNRFRK